MHAITFSLKRVQHRVLALSREVLGPFGITVARLDMLYAIGDFMYQSKLRHALGVSAPTVSRMVTSLERLGFLRRIRCSDDARQRLIAVTQAGRELVRRVMHAIESTGIVEHAITCAFVCAWYSLEAFADLADFESVLLYARDTLADTAHVPYIWHPDD